MSNRYLLLAPLLIIVYFFIHNTLENFYFLNSGLIVITIAKYLIITSTLFFAGYAFFKNRIKFTFIFSGLLFIFLFFGNIADTIDKYIIPQSSFFFKILREILLALLFILALILPRFWNQVKLKKFISFWIIYCSILIIYDTFHFIAFPPKEKKYFTKEVKNINLGSVSKPDVFFLLFDMYPSDSIFKNYLHFDNYALREFLNQKGFYTSSNSSSLYDHTFHSLSSTLNLDTLNYYHDSSLAEYKKNLISIKKTENSLLINSFKNAGYEINNYSVFTLDNKSSPLKFNMESYIGNNYTASTLFNRIYNNFDPDGFESSKRIPFLNFIKSSWSDDVQRDNAFLYNSFENILQQQQTKPAFNYFHFEIPHPPFIFDSSGRLQSLKSMYETSDVNKRIERYVSYTKYGNQLIIKMITKIFERYNGNAVIILQGDHGYREYANIFPEQVRYGILNAVYLPSKNYDNFHDSMQPIYTFKQILKNQFNTTVN